MQKVWLDEGGFVHTKERVSQHTGIYCRYDRDAYCCDACAAFDVRTCVLPIHVSSNPCRYIMCGKLELGLLIDGPEEPKGKTDD